MTFRLLLFTVFFAAALSGAQADDLFPGAGGKSDYQIILPDESLSPTIAEGLQQTARLIQTAFFDNGLEVEVVPESKDAKDKPGIYPGRSLERSEARQNTFL